MVLDKNVNKGKKYKVSADIPFMNWKWILERSIVNSMPKLRTQYHVAKYITENKLDINIE